jgi:Flp pilus assembly pilin Flp
VIEMLASALSAWMKLAIRSRSEQGQTLAEYAMILGLVAIVCVAALSRLGTEVTTLLAPVAGAF